MSNLQKAFQNKARLTANRGLRMADGGAVPDGDGDADDGLKGYDIAGDEQGLRMIHGGPVRGPGTGTSDSVPAHLSDGEYVLPTDTVQAVGVDKLDALKDATHKPVGMRAPGHFADGGLYGTISELWDKAKSFAPGGGGASPAAAPPADSPLPTISDPAPSPSPAGAAPRNPALPPNIPPQVGGQGGAGVRQFYPGQDAAPAAAPAAEAAEGAVSAGGRAMNGLRAAGRYLGGAGAVAGAVYEPAVAANRSRALDSNSDRAALAGESAARVAGGYAGGSLGASAGSAILPGVGTVIGGLAGGAAGYFAPDAVKNVTDYLGLSDKDTPLPSKKADAIIAARPSLRTPATAAPAPAAASEPDYSRLHEITAQSESGNADFGNDGKPITSPTGAKYAMQVQPTTAANPGYGIKPAQSDTPEEYNRVGKQYLSALNQQYGDPAKAWAAYNAGPGNVDKALADAKKNGGNWMDALASYQSPDNHKQTVDYVGKNMAALGGYSPAAARGMRSSQPAGMPPGYSTGEVDDNGMQKDGRVQIIRGLRSTYVNPKTGEEEELHGGPVRPDYNGEAMDAVSSGMRRGLTAGEVNNTLQTAGLRQNADAQMQLARNQQQMNQLEHQRAAAQFAQTNALSREREQRELDASVQKRQQDASNQMQKDLEAANTTVDANGKPTFDGDAVGRQRRSFERGMASLGVKSYADLDQNDREQMHAAAKLMDKVESDATNWPIPWKADHLGTSDPSELFGMTRDANGNGVMRNGKVIPARFLNKKDSDHIGGVPTDEFKSLFNQRSK